MSNIITCPTCARKLRMPDEMIGRKVRCPSCATAFTALAGEPGAGEALADAPAGDVTDVAPESPEGGFLEEPRPSQRRSRRDPDDDDYDDRPSRPPKGALPGK